MHLLIYLFKSNLVGEVNCEVLNLRAVRVNRAPHVSVMPQREKRLRTRDHQIAPDVELAVVKQQRLPDVPLDDAALFIARRSRL